MTQRYCRQYTELGQVQLYLVRHAQAGTEQAWKHDPHEVKTLGLPLSDRGTRQSLAVAAFLAQVRFDHMYTSDLLRAHQTARRIGECHGDSALHVMQELREVHAYHVEGGEKPPTQQVEDERQRVQQLCNLLRTFNNGERVLLVSHGNYLRFLLAMLSDCDPQQTVQFEMYNASLTTAFIDMKGVLRIQEMNNVQFLQDQDISII